MCQREQDFTSRATLGFAEVAQEALHFLSDYGFRLQSSDATIVRYASERVFVNVYHGRSSYELGLEVGSISRQRGDAAGYSMSELIRLNNHEEAECFRNFMATTPVEVKLGVQKLAEQLLRYGDRALRGDDLVFDALEQQRQKWASTFAADVAYRQISPKAAEAFRQREYRKAAELFESIRGELTPAELKKLEYAKKHA
jgi:hypothetical protein